jgi:hypothetical protein
VKTIPNTLMGFSEKREGMVRISDPQSNRAAPLNRLDKPIVMTTKLMWGALIILSKMTRFRNVPMKNKINIGATIEIKYGK